MELDYQLMAMGDRVARAVADAVPGLKCWHQPASGSEGRRIVLGIHGGSEGCDRIHSVSVVFLGNGVAIQEKRHARTDLGGGFAVELLAQRSVGRRYARRDLRSLEGDLAAAVAARGAAFDPVPAPGLGTHPMVELALAVAREAVAETAGAFEGIGPLDVHLNAQRRYGPFFEDALTFHTPRDQMMPVALRFRAGEIEVYDPETVRALGVATEANAYADLKDILVGQMMVYGAEPGDEPRP